MNDGVGRPSACPIPSSTSCSLLDDCIQRNGHSLDIQILAPELPHGIGCIGGKSGAGHGTNDEEACVGIIDTKRLSSTSICHKTRFKVQARFRDGDMIGQGSGKEITRKT